MYPNANSANGHNEMSTNQNAPNYQINNTLNLNQLSFIIPWNGSNQSMVMPTQYSGIGSSGSNVHGHIDNSGSNDLQSVISQLSSAIAMNRQQQQQQQRACNYEQLQSDFGICSGLQYTNSCANNNNNNFTSPLFLTSAGLLQVPPSLNSATPIANATPCTTTNNSLLPLFPQLQPHLFQNLSPPQTNASAMSFNQMPKLDASPNASNNNNWSSASAEPVNNNWSNCVAQIQLPNFATTNGNNNCNMPAVNQSFIENVSNHSKNGDYIANVHRCNGCNKKFTNYQDLVEHLNRVDSKKGYKCNLCCKSFARLGNLNNHKKIHGNSSAMNDPNILICTTKKAKTPQPKPFKCTECNKSFRNKSGLSNHRIIHNGVKPHKCKYDGCGKAFARSCDLTRHTRLHTGDKPFKCKYVGCGKEFTRSVQLRLHLMDHTGNRPYSCNVCKKGFKTLQNAQIHMRIHTGEKPYVCKYCQKRFTQSSSLNTHLASIHAS